MPTKTKKLPPFDKYFYYTQSVQSAPHDAELLWKMYRKSRPQKQASSSDPVILQEDFCGTAALCYEWAALDSRCHAVGIDLDRKALEWGKAHHTEEHSDDVEQRVTTICGDVLADHHIRPNVISAMNFSYFFIEERHKMLEYFRSSRNALQKEGLLVLDCFGGPAYQNAHLDKRVNVEEKFTYWWEVESFDALSHKMTCHLHYQRRGEAQRMRVFSYHWRQWSVPEITDILREAGFASIEYWSEGLDKKGDGDGKYHPVKEEKNCEAWVCYIVAKK